MAIDQAKLHLHKPYLISFNFHALQLLLLLILHALKNAPPLVFAWPGIYKLEELESKKLHSRKLRLYFIITQQ